MSLGAKGEHQEDGSLQASLRSVAVLHVTHFRALALMMRPPATDVWPLSLLLLLLLPPPPS
jgi:hypothetical protein